MSTNLHKIIRPLNVSNVIIIGKLTEDLHPKATLTNGDGLELVSPCKTYFLKTGSYFLAKPIDGKYYPYFPLPPSTLFVDFNRVLQPEEEFEYDYEGFTLPFYHSANGTGYPGKYACRWRWDHYVIENPHILGEGQWRDVYGHEST